MKGATKRKGKLATKPVVKRAAGQITKNAGRSQGAGGLTRSAQRPTRRGGRGAKRPSALASSAHVTPAGGNIFTDLGFAPEEAENLKIRSRLMSELRDMIEERSLTQAAAGELFGVAQPRVSDLVRGKIGLFTIDALVNMLTRAGIVVRVELDGKAG